MIHSICKLKIENEQTKAKSQILPGITHKICRFHTHIWLHGNVTRQLHSTPLLLQCSAVTNLKVSTIFKQGVLKFYLLLSLTNYVPILYVGLEDLVSHRSSILYHAWSSSAKQSKCYTEKARSCTLKDKNQDLWGWHCSIAGNTIACGSSTPYECHFMS